MTPKYLLFINNYAHEQRLGLTINMSYIRTNSKVFFTYMNKIQRRKMRNVSKYSEDGTEFRIRVKKLNAGMKMCNRSKKYKLSVNYKTRRKTHED